MRVYCTIMTLRRWRSRFTPLTIEWNIFILKHNIYNYIFNQYQPQKFLHWSQEVDVEHFGALCPMKFWYKWNTEEERQSGAVLFLPVYLLNSGIMTPVWSKLKAKRYCESATCNAHFILSLQLALDSLLPAGLLLSSCVFKPPRPDSAAVHLKLRGTCLPCRWLLNQDRFPIPNYFRWYVHDLQHLSHLGDNCLGHLTQYSVSAFILKRLFSSQWFIYEHSQGYHSQSLWLKI